MMLRLVGDGTLEGTWLEDAETGERVENVLEMRLVISGRQDCVAEIVLFKPQIDLNVTSEFTVKSD